MTDTAFYNDMAALVEELMNDFGTPATVRVKTTGPIGADGKAAVTTSDTPGLAVRISDKETLDALEIVTDIGYVFKGAVAPAIGHHIIHAGVTWEVMSRKAVNPEGNRLMISFHGVQRAE